MGRRVVYLSSEVRGDRLLVRLLIDGEEVVIEVRDHDLVDLAGNAVKALVNYVDFLEDSLLDAEEELEHCEKGSVWNSGEARYSFIPNPVSRLGLRESEGVKEW